MSVYIEMMTLFGSIQLLAACLGGEVELVGSDVFALDNHCCDRGYDVLGASS